MFLYALLHKLYPYVSQVHHLLRARGYQTFKYSTKYDPFLTKTDKVNSVTIFLA